MFLIIIPAAGFLDDRFFGLQKFNLPFPLSFDRPRNGLKGIQVFHLCPGPESIASHFPHGKVHIRAHRTLLQLTVGCPQILDDLAQLFQICNDFLRGTHVRLRYDLHKRHAASVVIYKRSIIPVVMDQFSGILLHVHLMNAHNFLCISRLNFYKSVSCNGKIQLRNLVVLGIVRIKVILPVKLAYSCDLTVGGKADRHGIFHHLFIQDRKGTRHPGAYRAGMGIRRCSECSAASAENLCLCCQFHMNLQPDDCLILFCHNGYASLPVF